MGPRWSLHTQVSIWPNIYAVRRHLSGLCLRLRRMNPTVEDAFLHMLSMWLVHFKSFDIERPKYGLLSTSLKYTYICSVVKSIEVYMLLISVEKLSYLKYRIILADFKKEEILTVFSTVNWLWGNRRKTDKDLSLWVDVDSKHIYENSACALVSYSLRFLCRPTAFCSTCWSRGTSERSP